MHLYRSISVIAAAVLAAAFTCSAQITTSPGGVTLPITSSQAFGTTANRGLGQEVYVAIRTDGKTGTGTAEDPYDASGGLPGTIWATISAAKPAVINWVPKFKNTVKIFTAATSGLITSLGHGLAVNDTIRVNSMGTLPAGLNRVTTYYVISSGLTVDTFKLSLTQGGSAVTITDTGSASPYTHQWNKYDPAESYVIHDRLPLWSNLEWKSNGATFLLANDYWTDPSDRLQRGAIGESLHTGDGGLVGYHDVTIRDGFFDCNNDGQTLPNSATGLVWLQAGYNNKFLGNTVIHMGSLATTRTGVEAFPVFLGQHGQLNGNEFTNCDQMVQTGGGLAAMSFSHPGLGLSETLNYQSEFNGNYYHDISCPEGSAIACLNIGYEQLGHAYFNTFYNLNRIAGIYVDAGVQANNEIAYNTFQKIYRLGGSSSFGWGIYIYPFANPVTKDSIHDNTFLMGQIGVAIQLNSGGGVSSGNIIANNYIGIYPGESGPVDGIQVSGLSGGTISRNTIESGYPTNQNIRIIDSSTGVVVHDNMTPDIYVESGSDILASSNRNQSGTLIDIPSVALTGRTGSITTTNFQVSGGIAPAGLYRVAYYVVATTAGTSGTLDVTIAWNDGTASRTDVNTAAITFGSTAFASKSVIVKANGSNNVTYAVADNSPVGSPVYAFYATMERLQ